MNHMGPEFKIVIQDLIKMFNQNPRWNATDINLLEATNISVALAVLKVENEQFIGDIGDIIRVHLTSEDMQKKDDDNIITADDLPNLAKSTFYMR